MLCVLCVCSVCVCCVCGVWWLRVVGPFLNGLEKPAHILIPSVSGRGILNTTAMMGSDFFNANEFPETQ